jgi:hypothetical protein
MPLAKKRVVRKKAQKVQKVQQKRTAPVLKVVEPKAVRSEILAKRMARTIGSGGSFDLASLLLVSTIGLVIVCFGVAALPAAYVPWRPAAWFVAERHLDIGILGVALMFLAGFILVVAGGWP